MFVPLLLAAAISAAPRPAYPALPTCPPGGASPLVSVTDVDGAYGDRSVAIVNAALNRDIPALTGLVAAEARLVLWRGDAGSGPGGRGPAGAAEFFSWFAPTDYQFLTGFAGPISEEICGPITVDLLLKGPDRSANLRFRYDRGMLVEVTGREVFVSDGQVRRPHVD